MHLCLVALWYLGSIVRPPPRPAQKIVEIEYKESAPGEPGGSPETPQAPPKKSKSSVKFKDLKPFSSSFSFRKEVHEFQPGASANGPSDSAFTAAGGWGHGSTGHQILRHLKHFQEYERLHSKVNGVLNYPGALGDRGHAAVINFQMVMNARGCKGEPRWRGRSNPYLMVYVRKLFERKICRAEFLNHVLGEQDQKIDFSFTFELVETMSLSRAPRPYSGIQGNLLVFYRPFPKSKLEWRLGPLRGLWGVPAVSLDFAWLYQNWEKWRKDIDPLDEFRGEEP